MPSGSVAESESRFDSKLFTLSGEKDTELMGIFLFKQVAFSFTVLTGFYPLALRPKGLCRCLHLSVRLSVRLSVCLSVHFWLVCAITRKVFNLSSPNLHQLCILSTYRLLSKMGSIDLDLPGHSGINFMNF